MPKVSMLLPVYNEEVFLNYSLVNTIKYVDEIIIVDGGESGPSTDNTKNIIDAYDTLYPGKIKYYTGIFRMENGSWDESASRNFALSKVTGDILMPHCGDMIYTDQDLQRIFEIINKYPEKRIIYCLFVEFWLDTSQIRLYSGNAMEAWYPVLPISDIPFVSMDLVSHYFNGPSLSIKDYTNKDFMFMPNVFRYHYGWISGFDRQVFRHIRNMTMGSWGESGKDILALGEKGIARWAIKHVLNYPNDPCGFVYTGKVPINKNFSYKDGYEETIAKYKAQYGEDLLSQ